jgi:hypothetical protein
MAGKRRLDELTRRWQQRRDERRQGMTRDGVPRETADPVRAARAASAFPFRRMTPAEYVARHGSDMAGFTYDDYTYADAALQDWLDEVGRLLRERSEAHDGDDAPGDVQAQDASEGET